MKVTGLKWHQEEAYSLEDQAPLLVLLGLRGRICMQSYVSLVLCRFQHTQRMTTTSSPVNALEVCQKT